MPKIYLYAELLTHIRTLSLHASLQTEKREGTKVDVSTDKKVVSVTHDGETQRLYLPTQIKGDASITFPLQKATEISARVQIEDEHEWKCTVSDEIEAPWMASDLVSNTEVKCRHCKVNILASGTINQWKNLPSEHWAELMDFWFCHKPHGNEHEEDAAEAKGFSARSKLAMARGTGMTDLVSVVLHVGDCSNIKAAETQTNPDLTVLRCTNCTQILGTTNQDEFLIRLHKSSIAVRNNNSAEFLTYPYSIFACAQILTLIESTALKKFVAYTATTEGRDNSSIQPLELWVFNPDIYYSCSAYEGNSRLSNAVPAEADSPSKLNQDDTSQIYGDRPADEASEVIDTKMSTEESSGMQTHIKSAPGSDLSNPHGDDVSQIYGAETARPQMVEGEIEIEVPVRSKDEQTSEQPSTGIASFMDSETPLVTSTTSQRADLHLSNNGNSTTEPPTEHPTEHVNLVHHACKIFYKPLPKDVDVTTFLQSHSSSHEDLFITYAQDLQSLRETLENSTAMLPASARTFQDWSVGLLHRFEKVPSGLGVMQENPLARGIKAKDGRVTRWDIGHGAEGLYA